MAIVDVDCLVVGGGGLGILTALDLRLRRRREVVVVSSPWDGAGIPLVDSLRNHSWCQSGFVYANQIESRGDLPPAAYLIGVSRLKAFEFVGLRPPEERGIFGVDQQGLKNLLEAARRLRMEHEVSVLMHAEGKARMGAYWVKDRNYALVPDTSFDEELLLSTARKVAEHQAGVQFFSGHVSLKRDSAGAFFAQVGETTFRPRLMVLCAGFGTPALLEQVQVEHQLVVRSSGLIRLHGCDDGLLAPLYADRTTHLSVVKHGRSKATPEGCLVIGSGHSRPVDSPEHAPRVLSRERKLEIANLMPHPLDSRAMEEGTAILGYKTERLNEEKIPMLDPAVAVVSPNLIWAVPGKVTLAYYTADRIGNLAATMLPRLSGARSSRVTVNLPRWEDPLQLHHHNRYRSVDESA